MSNTTVSSRVSQLNWAQINASLDASGYAHIRGFLPRQQSRTLKALYSNPSTRFRKTIDMQQHNFGDGEYKYFAYPLPKEVAQLRRAFYARLAPTANRWAQMLGTDHHWPAHLAEFSEQCKQAGQGRATPLLLHYQAGGYNRLHQDIYGEVFFPLQVAILLDQPGEDFTGGEFLLVEQAPRMQSRAMVVPMQVGDAVIFSVRERPQQGKTRLRRCQMRHGVSTLHRGERTTLGLIFHDA